MHMTVVFRSLGGATDVEREALARILAKEINQSVEATRDVLKTPGSVLKSHLDPHAADNFAKHLQLMNIDVALIREDLDHEPPEDHVPDEIIHNEDHAISAVFSATQELNRADPPGTPEAPSGLLVAEPPQPAPTTNNSKSGFVAELSKLAELRQQGLLSEDEFHRAKQKLLQ